MVSSKQIRRITKSIIEQLPFLAIECSLAGISPLQEDGYSEEAGDFLYDMTKNCTAEFAACVDEIIWKANSKQSWSWTQKASVMLSTLEDEEEVDHVASKLVRHRFAKCNEDHWTMDECFLEKQSRFQVEGDKSSRITELLKRKQRLRQTEPEPGTTSGSGTVDQDRDIAETVPTKYDNQPSLPRDMPGLAVVKGVTIYDESVPFIEWYQQDQTVIILKFSLRSFPLTQLDEQALHVQVERDLLKFQYVMHNTLASNVILVDQRLHLMHPVVQGETSVNIKGLTVEIQLPCVKKGVWNSQTPFVDPDERKPLIKPWIKLAADHINNTCANETNVDLQMDLPCNIDLDNSLNQV